MVKSFDFDKIACFTQRDIIRLLKDEGIIRHRGKIEAVVNNARCAQDLVKQNGSLAAFMQAVGLINDHVQGCVTRAEVEQARMRFKRPQK
jgi:DNA-3-methyladenine glycosylase I